MKYKVIADFPVTLNLLLRKISKQASIVVASRTAMSNPGASCGPVDCFVRPSLGFCCSKVSYVLTTCPYFDNLEFDISDAGGPQCHILTSGTIAVRIRTLSGH